MVDDLSVVATVVDDERPGPTGYKFRHCGSRLS
jgi:hypothetical protein